MMHHQQQSLQPLLLLVLLLPPSLSEPNNTKYLDCLDPTVYTCGVNSYNISFPFGVPGRPDYCSYPAFSLNCELDSLMINIGGSSGGGRVGYYQVKQINYTKRVLTVANPIFLGMSCPQLFGNANLNFKLFGYTGVDVNLTVYINCTIPTFLREIPCLTGQLLLPSYYTIDTALLTDLSGSCGFVGVVPLIQTAAHSIDTGAMGFGDALQEGFEVTWSVGKEWCGGCADSKGVCGYDAGSPDDRICFCPNTTSNTGTCAFTAVKGEKSNAKTIAIGVGVGFVVLIAMCFLCFLWFRRKRKRHNSTTSKLLIQSASSDPSSIKDTEFGSINYHTHIFSYQELQEATNCFDVSRELGDGGFGTVYKGKLRDGRDVAVKRLYENNCRGVEQFMNEVEILSRLRHKNLVTLYGCTSRHSRELLLVYEFVSNGTVADHLHGPRVAERALSWPVRLRIAIETADALSYLHAIEPQIIHRDVKTNNILLDDSFHVKVADFGLSRLFPIDATHVSTLPQGTPGYVDPEYHQCYQLTDKSDVYSFGVVLVELISSKPAVDISRDRHEINLAYMAINKIQNRELEQLVDPELGFRTDVKTERMIMLVAELAFRCLQGEKEMRPSIKEVLEELQRIQSGVCEAETREEADIQTREDAQLLKTTPFSPDSVTGGWESRLTTPNSSG